MTEPSNNLSLGGQRRRDEILRVALRDAANRRYARIERRLGAALVVLFATGATWVLREPSVRPYERLIASRQNSVREIPKTSGLKPAAEPLRIQIVRTDPDIVRRLSVPPTPPRWTTIGDDELLASLAAAGKPAGLIEINGQTRIVYR